RCVEAVIIARAHVRPEYAVTRRHCLLPERLGWTETFADILERAADRPHFAIAQRCTNGLRCQARVVDADNDTADVTEARSFQHTRCGIACSPHAESVEVV